jgi:hypothetical protein
MSVNFSHTIRCHIRGQSKVTAISVQSLGVEPRAPTQNLVIFVMFTRHRKKKLHSFIRPRILPLCSCHPSPKTKYLHMSMSLHPFCLPTVSFHPSTFLQVLSSFVFPPFSFQDSLYTAFWNKRMSIRARTACIAIRCKT